MFGAHRVRWLVVMVLAMAACSDKAPVGGALPRSSGSTASASGSYADSPGREWTGYMHDPSNTRANVTGTSITGAKVSTHTKSWEINALEGVGGTPAVVGDVAYLGDWNGGVWAVDANRGKEVWHTPIAGGFIVDGPAVTADAVFIA